MFIQTGIQEAAVGGARGQRLAPPAWTDSRLDLRLGGVAG